MIWSAWSTASLDHHWWSLDYFWYDLKCRINCLLANWASVLGRVIESSWIGKSCQWKFDWAFYCFVHLGTHLRHVMQTLDNFSCLKLTKLIANVFITTIAKKNALREWNSKYHLSSLGTRETLLSLQGSEFRFDVSRLLKVIAKFGGSVPWVCWSMGGAPNSIMFLPINQSLQVVDIIDSVLWKCLTSSILG